MRPTYAIAAIVVALAQPALGDTGYVVQKSNISAFRVEMRIPFGAQISIPAGGTITLADEHGGQRVCVGSYDGPVESCPGGKTCTMLKKFLGQCDPAVGPGGVDAGGTRGGER